MPRKPRPLEIEVSKGQTNAEGVANKLLGPLNRHGAIAPYFSGAIAKGLPEADRPGLVEYACALRDRAKKTRTGDLSEVTDLLLCQALTLDGIFTESARRAATNMEAGYLQAFETYARLAFKAQSQSRSTLEALIKLHQPREQIVRHVHVNDGGQAIVADEFHQHAGGSGNAKEVEQSHEPCAAAPRSSALSGAEPAGKAVPVSVSRRKETVPTARRPRRGAKGKP